MFFFFEQFGQTFASDTDVPKGFSSKSGCRLTEPDVSSSFYDMRKTLASQDERDGGAV